MNLDATVMDSDAWDALTHSWTHNHTLSITVCVHVVPNSVHSRVNFAQTTDPDVVVIQTRCEKSG